MKKLSDSDQTIPVKNTASSVPVEQGIEDSALEQPMMTESVKKPFPVLIVVAVALVILGIVGFITIQKAFSKPTEKVTNEESMLDESLPDIDSSITVNVGNSKTQQNAVLIEIKGLNTKYSSISYEIQYDSEGVGKGVTSGSKPIDVVGKDMFDREIYLGTCSKNVCKPDLGVSKVSVVLIFTDEKDKRSKFSKEYEL